MTYFPNIGLKIIIWNMVFYFLKFQKNDCTLHEQFDFLRSENTIK